MPDERKTGIRLSPGLGQHQKEWNTRFRAAMENRHKVRGWVRDPVEDQVAMAILRGRACSGRGSRIESTPFSYLATD